MLIYIFKHKLIPRIGAMKTYFVFLGKTFYTGAAEIQ